MSTARSETRASIRRLDSSKFVSVLRRKWHEAKKPNGQVTVDPTLAESTWADPECGQEQPEPD